jgi:hypothetical protein
MSDILGFAVLWVYLSIAGVGWVITWYSRRSARYHPVVTLMASGMGVPVVGLLIIRLARLAGYAQRANDVWAQLVLLLCFAYTAWTWLAALLHVRAQIQAEREERAALGC